MSMTGKEFRDYVVRTFKRTDKDIEIYEATQDVINYIKETIPLEDYKDVAKTVAITNLGDYSFTLPTNLDHLIGDVVIQDDTSSYPLHKISKERYDQLYPNQEATNVSKAKPTHYCIYQNAIYLGSVPDSVSYTYQINYATNTTTVITSSTDPIAFTTHNRKMLKHLVVGNLYADLENPDLATLHMDIGNSLFDILKEKESKNTDTVEIVKYKDV